jgi:hypothetical protein
MADRRVPARDEQPAPGTAAPGAAGAAAAAKPAPALHYVEFNISAVRGGTVPAETKGAR